MTPGAEPSAAGLHVEKGGNEKVALKKKSILGQQQQRNKGLNQTKERAKKKGEKLLGVKSSVTKYCCSCMEDMVST